MPEMAVDCLRSEPRSGRLFRPDSCHMFLPASSIPTPGKPRRISSNPNALLTSAFLPIDATRVGVRGINQMRRDSALMR